MSSLQSTLPSQQVQVGTFIVDWQLATKTLSVRVNSDPERIIWQSCKGLFSIAVGRAEIHESRGFFHVKEQKLVSYSTSHSIESIAVEGEQLSIQGSFTTGGRYQLTMQPMGTQQLRCFVQLEGEQQGHPVNRVRLHFKSHAEEGFFGFGEQLSRLNLKGYSFPILSQEPGIGRGKQPLTGMMNMLAGAGGAWYQSGAPAPAYLSTDNYAFCLENDQYCIFDLQDPEKVSIEVFHHTIGWRIFAASSPLEALTEYSDFCGRMPLLPEWLDRGAIIGMQGGTKRVYDMLEKLRQHNTPIAAFWLQDWIGSRKTSIGKQLWWNWEVDAQTYDNWEQLISTLQASHIAVMSYINPFLVDATEKGQVNRNLYQEAKAKGYLICDAKQQVYEIVNTSFSAALVDLSLPAARSWIKQVIKDQLIASGVKGWMADFGEALPFDAVLGSGESAADWHNRYPVEWAKINREAIEEAGKAGEIIAFHRSGYTQSPRYCTLFWLGDQLTDWGREDGIKSAVNGLLSSGMSGVSLNHGDIGGYTATTIPWLPFRIPGLGYTRGRELLCRWIELCAFTAVFRTHEGNQPDRHVQIDADTELLAHFARFARIYQALAPYRRKLFQQATNNGWPVVRHPWLHYPEDHTCRELTVQFMLGSEWMIAPVLDAKTDTLKVYLPSGQWVHLWSGKQLQSGWHNVDAPMGQPGVFFAATSVQAQHIRQQLISQGDIDA